ncbi:hypothetical protein [Parendozoicomonas haliclonae]|uniref:Uncharacterized protein n=1 Tax=Parendozoicomonas haliclonae TaxID=1960125 RepID=A0A1X7AHR5_9GAMM|nr:hypothetical protein [Parendozoicomonas haliclonae]SMA42999.1 hypothetical protein EHSB41UT_01536 [Parendozoicomonas haliclonae]
MSIFSGWRFLPYLFTPLFFFPLWAQSQLTTFQRYKVTQSQSTANSTATSLLQQYVRPSGTQQPATVVHGGVDTENLAAQLATLVMELKNSKGNRFNLQPVGTIHSDTTPLSQAGANTLPVQAEPAVSLTPEESVNLKLERITLYHPGKDPSLKPDWFSSPDLTVQMVRSSGGFSGSSTSAPDHKLYVEHGKDYATADRKYRQYMQVSESLPHLTTTTSDQSLTFDKLRLSHLAGSAATLAMTDDKTKTAYHRLTEFSGDWSKHLHAIGLINDWLTSDTPVSQISLLFLSEPTAELLDTVTVGEGTGHITADAHELFKTKLTFLGLEYIYATQNAEAGASASQAQEVYWDIEKSVQEKLFAEVNNVELTQKRSRALTKNAEMMRKARVERGSQKHRFDRQHDLASAIKARLQTDSEESNGLADTVSQFALTKTPTPSPRTSPGENRKHRPAPVQSSLIPPPAHPGVQSHSSSLQVPKQR